MYINVNCKLMELHWFDGCFYYCSRIMSSFHPHLILSRSSISALPHAKVFLCRCHPTWPSAVCLSWHPEVLFSCFRGPPLSCPLPCLSACFLSLHPWLCLHRCTEVPSFIFFLFHSRYTHGFLHFLGADGSWPLCPAEPPSELPGKGWLIHWCFPPRRLTQASRPVC